MAEQKEREKELEREWMAQDKWDDFTNWLVYAKLPEVRASALREAKELLDVLEEFTNAHGAFDNCATYHKAREIIAKFKVLGEN